MKDFLKTSDHQRAVLDQLVDQFLHGKDTVVHPGQQYGLVAQRHAGIGQHAVDGEFFPAGDDGAHEVVGVAKVPVEAPLGDAEPGRQGLDPDAIDPAPRERFPGGGQPRLRPQGGCCGELCGCFRAHAFFHTVPYCKQTMPCL